MQNSNFESDNCVVRLLSLSIFRTKFKAICLFFFFYSNPNIPIRRNRVWSDSSIATVAAVAALAMEENVTLTQTDYTLPYTNQPTIKLY